VSGLFEDLAKWEEGRVGLMDLEARHPTQDVRGLVSVHVQLAAAGSVAAPDPVLAWQKLRLRLPDRTAGPMDGVVRWARRPIVATAASMLLAGSAAALTSESVREAIRNFFGEVQDVLGGEEFSPPPDDNRGLPVEDDDEGTETTPDDD
jgi:hypothetical protein